MKRLILSTLGLASILSIPADAQVRAVFLLDRSGSMAGWRCSVSAAWARRDVETFFTNHPTGEVTIRELTTAVAPGSRYVPGPPESPLLEWHSAAAYGGNLARAQAEANRAIDLAHPCTGGTPLATAICESTTSVLSRGFATGCVVLIYSDGGENSSGPLLCSGPDDVHAITGRCDFDRHHIGPAYAGDGSGGPSWQQLTCNSINALRLFCDVVVNIYEFDVFRRSSTTGAVFSFLRSAARGTGGYVVSVPSNAPADPPFSVSSIGCANNAGFEPILQTSGLPRTGQTMMVSQSAGNLLSFVCLGLTPQQTPIDLGVIGAAGCLLGVSTDICAQGPSLSLQIPQNAALIGTRFDVQGVAVDINQSSSRWLLTTNRLTATISQ